ncbi:MAG: helix-turn-helix transcriptional regulator, partial [Blautia massiliensis (ex Durand et al. 2017)]
IPQCEIHCVVCRSKLGYSSFRKGGFLMSFRVQFSHDVLCARQARNWTQPYVADSISITLRQYQNIESGRCTPRTDTFLKLVYLFGLDIEKYKKGFILHVPLPAYRK